MLRARDPNAGKLILFVVGGITRAEVYQLQALEKELAHEQLVIGSTGILTANQFLDVFSGKKLLIDDDRN